MKENRRPRGLYVFLALPLEVTASMSWRHFIFLSQPNVAKSSLDQALIEDKHSSILLFYQIK